MRTRTFLFILSIVCLLVLVMAFKADAQPESLIECYDTDPVYPCYGEIKIELGDPLLPVGDDLPAYSFTESLDPAAGWSSSFDPQGSLRLGISIYDNGGTGVSFGPDNPMLVCDKAGCYLMHYVEVMNSTSWNMGSWKFEEITDERAVEVIEGRRLR